MRPRWILQAMMGNLVRELKPRISGSCAEMLDAAREDLDQIERHIREPPVTRTIEGAAELRLTIAAAIARLSKIAAEYAVPGECLDTMKTVDTLAREWPKGKAVKG